MGIQMSSSDEPAGTCAVTRGSGPHRRRAGVRKWRSATVAAAAIMLLACQAGLAAAAPCDDTPGVSMTARHYNYDLLKMPDWSNTKCVDAEETKTVSDPSWPESPSGNFAIDIDGSTYDSNVAIVFEGYFDIAFLNTKFFQLNSTDGSRLFIDDQLVVDHDGVHAYTGSGTTKWPLNGPKRFKISVHYFKGANPAGTGLAVSWGDLRELYAFPIAAEEFKLNACAASAPPPPVYKPSPPPHAPGDTRDTNHPGRKPPTKGSIKHPTKTRRTLPKACGGRCGRPKSSRGQHQNRKLPKACGGKCGRPLKRNGRKIL